MTVQPRRLVPRDFLLGFLSVFSVCSLILNIILFVRVTHPSFWSDMRLARLHPSVVRSQDHVRGSANAPVTVIEYADFQCPYCRELHASLTTAVNAGEIRWVYRNDPLTSIHPLARKEAEAAECAGAQGKFWEYADALFRSQADMGPPPSLEPQLLSLAENVKLDRPAFQECLDSGKLGNLVITDMQEAEKLVIRATPTIFVNSQRQEGAVSYEGLKKLVEKQRGRN